MGPARRGFRNAGRDRELWRRAWRAPWSGGWLPTILADGAVADYSAAARAFASTGFGAAPAVSSVSISSIERPRVSMPNRKAIPASADQNARNSSAGTIKSSEALGLTKFDWPQISARHKGPITLPRL